MPVTIVVGGQFGSEGKGKVAHFLAKQMGATAAVRVGGSNAGHTVIDSFGNPLVLRQLPTASILPNVTCVLGAGSYIHPEILLQEINRVGLSADRLLIDPHAVIITEVEETSERLGNLRTSIGSTLSGTGAAVRRRLDRNTEVPLALNHPILSRFVKPVIPYLRELLDAGRRVIIEGTQGFGLSVLHSPHYPFVTTRDTTAAAFISETGLSPFDVDDVVMVLRAMPIRVGGNSGPLPFEIDWHIVTTESESPIPLMEYTSVTKRVRRIARFDPEIVRAALISNKPTRIVLNHVDYIDDKCRQSGNVTDKARAVVDQIEHSISAAIDYVGISPAILIPSHATFAKALVG